MKVYRSIIGLSAAVAMVAVLTGCGKSATATDPGQVLDTTPPPAVDGISMLVNPITGKGTISWSASVAPDVASYEVFGVDGSGYSQIGTSNIARYELPELSDVSTYAVRAVDIAGNRSPYTLYDVGDINDEL